MGSVHCSAFTAVASYSDEYTELYPYASDSANVGGTHMKTAQEIKEEKKVRLRVVMKSNDR